MVVTYHELAGSEPPACYVERMRLLALVLLVFGCGARSSTGPAWPTRSDPGLDGGESLAPREARGTVEVETADEKPSDAPAPARTSDKTPDTPAATPAVAPNATLPAGNDDPFTTEEIVIEIGD
jgi:hypothetical protein